MVAERRWSAWKLGYFGLMCALGLVVLILVVLGVIALVWHQSIGI